MTSTLTDHDTSADSMKKETMEPSEDSKPSDVEVDGHSRENNALESQINNAIQTQINNAIETEINDALGTLKLSDIEMDAPRLENNGLDTQTNEQRKDDPVNEVLACGMPYDSGPATESEEEYKIETPENLFNSEGADRNEESSSDESDKQTDSDSEEDPRTAMQKRRALALKMQHELLAKLRIKEEQDALEEAANARTTKINRRSNVVRRKRTSGDPSFTFGGYIPAEKRRSARLQNINPEFKYTDLPDDDNHITKKRRFSSGDWSHIEDIVYEPKISHGKRVSHSSRPPIIPVEEVTKAMLDNIATKSSAKTHDTDKGTSCHQCRQKTIDTKTCCRNINCVGVRGQFCGCCIKNRYGEDAAVALLDPDWTCFVCRGVCNCSFCRAKAGKKPTGILAPMVQKYGYDSVQQFLEQAKSKATAKEIRGFTAEHAHSKDGKTQRLFCEYKTLSEIEELKKIPLENQGNDEDTTEGYSDDEFDEMMRSPKKMKYNDVSPQAESKIEGGEQGEDDFDGKGPETSNKNPGLFKISGTLFGGKKNRKPQSPAGRKQGFSGEKLLGFSSDGRQAVFEGQVCVPLYREDM